MTLGAFQSNDAGRTLAISRVTESGRRGQPVAERSGRAGHRLEVRASLGNRDEPLQLIEGQRPAVVPAVFLGVEAGHSLERVLSQPAGAACPSANARMPAR